MSVKLESQITFLGTKDLETTHDFYTRILGFPLVLDQGKCRIYQTIEHAYLGFCQREEEVVAQGVIVTLVTQEVDKWYQSLLERGVIFEHPPAFNPTYKIYHCFLKDPNDYLIEIQRFEDPMWSQESH